MTGRPPSPTGPARAVAAILKLAREQRGLTQTQAAERLGKPHTYISKIERLEQKIRQADLEILLGFYEQPAEVIAALVDMNRQAGQRPWWRDYRNVISEEFGLYLGLETDADVIRDYECQAFPGLLQIEAYARALMGHAARRADDAELAKRVELRLARQAVLSAAGPPLLHAVVSEGVLRQEIGGSGVLREQLLHVAKMSEARNITFQVVPYKAGEHAGFSGSFNLMSFRPLPPPFQGVSADAVATQDNLLGVVTHYRPAQTEIYQRVWEEICAVALPPDESRQMLHRIAQGQT